MSGWDGIDEFVAVATAGSFTAGARALGASTTHVSRAIARLEGRVQAQLLHRTTRTMRLTETGRIFLDQCRRIIMERDEAVAAISEQGEPQGELRVTCSTAMGERFIAPLLRGFAEAHPRLAVRLDLTNRMVDIVAEGYDLAIRTGLLADSRLTATRIASRTLYTCAAPAYLDRYGRPESVADLADHQCLGGTSAHWRFRHRGKLETMRPKGRWHCNSGAAVLGAALAGMGLCQLPEFYVLPHIARGELEIVLADHVVDDEPIWAVYPQRRHLLPKISGFVTLMRRDLPGAMLGAG